MSRAEYEEDLHAELGYRTAGRRELYQREWFSLRGDPDEAAPTPKSFDALVNRLRVKKWAKENPEKRKTIANRYAAKPEVRQRGLANSRRRRHSRFHASNPVIICADCQAEFCPIKPPRGGQPRKFCSAKCETRSRYLRTSNPKRRQGRRIRLTDAQRQTICARFAAGERAALLAKEFGVVRTHINAIWRTAKSQHGSRLIEQLASELQPPAGERPGGGGVDTP